MAEHLQIKCDELLKKIEDNNLKAKEKIKIIESYNNKENEVTELIDLSFVGNEDDLVEKLVVDDCDEEDEISKFESFVSLYLPDFLKLSGDFSLEDLIKILPPKSNGYYKDLIYRLQAEVLKEINEFSMFDITTLSKEDLDDYKELLDCSKKKLSLLKSALHYEESNEDEETTTYNELVLVPTSSGNIRILDDLQHIAPEYYQDFFDIIYSIVDSSFYGLRKFVNNDAIGGICEVRKNKARVIFERLSDNHYAVISAFVKKVDNDKFYRQNIVNKVVSFRKIENTLIENTKNSEFINENNKNVEEMFRILGVEDIKEYKKGGING